MENKQIFSTTNADLAAFLLMEEVKFIGVSTHPVDRKIVVLNFLDDRQICYDLERVYLNGSFKKFRDMHKYILRKIHEKIREG
jgi:hypothetical protein